jgi:hypothetical protein
MSAVRPFRRGARAWARKYIERGWAVVRLKGKAPFDAGWQKRTYTEADFTDPKLNVGVKMGAPSGGLVDVDLDSPEALALADDFLPPTEAVFGRASTPRAHRLYKATPADKRTEQFKDPTIDDDHKAMLVELRATGGQTMAPGSIHPESGEAIDWVNDGAPLATEYTALLARVQRLAAAVLLVRHYPAKTKRNLFALAFAGAVLRGGWTETEAADFIRTVAVRAGDEEADKRATAVRSTATKIATGEETTGNPTAADLLSARVWAAAAKWLGLRAAQKAGGAPEFFYRGGATWMVQETKAGPVEVQLANVEIEIVEHRLRDDGGGNLETIIVVELRAKNTAPQTHPLTPEQYVRPDIWLRQVNPRYAIAPRQTSVVLDQAIPTLSTTMRTVRVYAHTGPRRIGEGWVYLHPGLPPSVVVVDLEGEGLKPMRLPYPAPTGEALRGAVQASVAMLTVGPAPVMYALHGAAYRAPLAAIPYDTRLVLVGEQQSGKSELAALAQQHFGAEYTRLNLPGNFRDTLNSAEHLAHAMAGMVGVFDDLNPEGTEADYRRARAAAAALVRGTGKGRLTRDIRQRTKYRPRCLVIMTVEEAAFQPSSISRAVILQVKAGEVKPGALRAAQKAARAGQYAGAMAAFLAWLMPRYEEVTTRARAWLDFQRDASAADADELTRLPEGRAQLLLGVYLFAAFAWESGALAADEVNSYLAAGAEALQQVVRAQRQPRDEADPIINSLELIAAALRSGRAHLARDDGNVPAGFEAMCGWQRDPQTLQWRQRGPCIGWVSIEKEILTALYLNRLATYGAAREMQRSTGVPFRLGEREWTRRLHERGLLVKAEREREVYTVRVQINGEQVPVLWLAPVTVFGGAPAAHVTPEPDEM